MSDHASHLAPADRHLLAPCADPLHQHAVAEAAELRRLVSALVSNACSRDLAAALRSLNEGHAADEAAAARDYYDNAIGEQLAEEDRARADVEADRWVDAS